MAKKKEKLRILLLSGGSLAGSWQVGVLKKLIIDKEQDFDVIAGTSVGSIAAAQLSQGMTGTGEIKKYLQDYLDIWMGMKSSKDIVKKRCFGGLNAVFGRSIYDNSGLVKVIQDNIDVSRIARSGKTCVVSMVNMSTGKHEIAHAVDKNGVTNENFNKCILASTSIPVVFPMVKIYDNTYVDGGLREAFPVKCVLDIVDKYKGDIEITAIGCSPEDLTIMKPKKMKLFDKVNRIIDMMTNEIYMNDLTVLTNYNVSQFHAYFPSKPPLEDSLNASGDEIRASIEDGYTNSEFVEISG